MEDKWILNYCTKETSPPSSNSKMSAVDDAQVKSEDSDDFDGESTMNMEPVESEESRLEFCCTFCKKVFNGSRVVAHAMFHFRKDECMFCGTMFKDDLLAMMHLSDHIEKLKKSKELTANKVKRPCDTKDDSTPNSSVKAKAVDVCTGHRPRGRPRKAATSPKSESHRQLSKSKRQNVVESTQLTLAQMAEEGNAKDEEEEAECKDTSERSSEKNRQNVAELKKKNKREDESGKEESRLENANSCVKTSDSDKVDTQHKVPDGGPAKAAVDKDDDAQKLVSEGSRAEGAEPSSQPGARARSYSVKMNGQAAASSSSSVCIETLAEYGKKPYMRPPPTAYLDESSTDELQAHLLQQKCSNLFGFDSDDEGKPGVSPPHITLS
ncbi:unnamed protein product [Tetraodon nigroviridis]|uniref:(spotted green pufferfish) hypothetical protein n=1 Tax=Tetraodon nigroviridis TaxID=99883 RepID=Q4SMD4_TETNG|nr:unnamed protein product [Tetraodon nigroviridis]